MAGGELNRDCLFGETDGFGYNIVKDPRPCPRFPGLQWCHLILGIDIEKLTL